MYADDIPTQKESQQIADVYKKRSRHACSVVRVRLRLEIATTEATGFITNGKSLKTKVGEYEGTLLATGFRPVGQCVLTL
jgi:hypothetical protein